MKRTNSKYHILAAAALPALLVASCGREEPQPADDQQTIEKVPVAKIDSIKGTYIFGNDVIEVPLMSSSEWLARVRARELSTEQTKRRDNINRADYNKAATDAVAGWKDSGLPLIDPLIDSEGSFEQLDADDDDKLSLSEFAVYGLADANRTEQNGDADAKRPYVGDMALNRSAEDFVRLDTDGDMAISKSEFDAITK